MKNILVLIFSLVLFSSCTRTMYNCAQTDSRETAINISIVDDEGNSLIGEDKNYKPADIKLTRGSQEIVLIFNEFGETTLIKLFYSEMESGKEYQLKLNDQETAELNLKLETVVSECFDFLSVETFLLNGQEIQEDSDSNMYIIQK